MYCERAKPITQHAQRYNGTGTDSLCLLKVTAAYIYVWNMTAASTSRSISYQTCMNINSRIPEALSAVAVKKMRTLTVVLLARAEDGVTLGDPQRWFVVISMQLFIKERLVVTKETWDAVNIFPR